MHLSCSDLRLQMALVPSTSSNVPDFLRTTHEFVKRRYLFNIEQIEKRYSTGGSGIVFGVGDDTVEFDEELCGAQDDRECVDRFKREANRHNRSYGSTLLSTPAADPDENDPKNITRWKKLNMVGRGRALHRSRSATSTSGRPRRPSLPRGRRRRPSARSRPGSARPSRTRRRPGSAPWSP